MALRTKFIQRVITARNAEVDGETVYEAPIDLDHDVAEINEHIETEEGVHNAVEKLENLKASMERFAEEGELPESTKFFAGIVYKDALKSGGLVVDEVSLESYAEDISLESVADTIKRVWKTIFEFISGLFKKVAGFFTKSEEQAEAAVKEAEDAVKTAKRISLDGKIIDEDTIKQLAKLALVPSSGHWSIPVDGGQELGTYVDKASDTIELTKKVIYEFVEMAAETIDGLMKEQQSHGTMQDGGAAIETNFRFFSNGPLQLDNGDLYALIHPVVGGSGTAGYYERNGSGPKQLVAGKPIIKISYIPTEIKVSEVEIDELAEQLAEVTSIFSQSTKYRSKLSKKFDNYASFLEKYDVDKMAEVIDLDDPNWARSTAEHYRSNIIRLASFISSPAALGVYIDTMRAIKTVSKILKDAVKE